MPPSLVDDILQPNVGLEAALATVEDRIRELKLGVQSQLSQHLTHFLPSYAQILELESQLAGASQEVDTLIHSIRDKVQPEVEESLQAMGEVEQQLETFRSMAATIQQLGSIHSHLEHFDKVQCESDTLATAQIISQMSSLLEECRSSLDDSELAATLTDRFALKKHILVMGLHREWESMVRVDGASLVLPGEGSKRFLTLLQSLHLVQELSYMVRELGFQLNSQFIQPLLQDPTAQLQEVRSDFGQVSLTFKCTEPLAGDTLNVLHNLTTLLVTLHRHLDNSGEPWQVGDNSLEPPRLLGLLGSQLGAALSKAIVEECLEPALRTKCKDNYNSIVAAGSKLQDLLLEIGFLTTDQLDSFDSIQNMDVFFSRWMCEDLLAQARTIIKKNLYETFVYEDSEKFRIPAVDGEVSGEPAPLSPNVLTLRNIYHFPTCQISTSMKELLVLLEQVLEKAVQETSKMGVKLLYTAQHICELYCAVAPVAHCTAIQTLPQQTAIFHNNCMFLGHNLLLLGHKYQARLPSSEVTFTFVDMVPKIRQLGVEAFLELMKSHRKILLEFVSGTEVLEQLADGDMGLVPEMERAIRQMVAHLNLLRNVWHQVLPEHVFLRAIGTLANSCLEELISRVTKLEDIHSDGASLLVMVFKGLMDQLCSLFKVEGKESKENGLALAMQHIRLWTKFCELVRLLEASMRDIVKRWADGRGALAAVFTEAEVCHLIRALFQNTERRAAALSQIRHKTPL